MVTGSTNHFGGVSWGFITYSAIHLLAYHYIDVIMTTMASQFTSLTVVYSTVYSDADQRKHQSSASLAFVWGIHRDRWIPRTKGQLRGKCFHLMTSSCDEPNWTGVEFIDVSSSCFTSRHISYFTKYFIYALHPIHISDKSPTVSCQCLWDLQYGSKYKQIHHCNNANPCLVKQKTAFVFDWKKASPSYAEAFVNKER